MNRRYKQPEMQKTYDTCISKGANDFMRLRGGAMQCAFMDGYHGIKPIRWSPGSIAWACFMAGKDRRKLENQGKMQPAQVNDKRLLEMK